ncbi:hypothetical protein A1O7_02812 [Cladophialophora yegresii CBS 114405]|uniref:Uncharacterized protein n=1 Tax=Cladophialophora yegresii CBS 114405 TaxID=1182544 RepID=W9W368_9EURO|nr:uncharacterized protein A1O7_02812 [Cladophialophora yegresii CBS 114405]EXJ62378.1 hypothetical protein A1O7_02812 [Cladophialophora yegresii CBS 114405]
MLVKSASRIRKRHSYFHKSVAKGLLKRARTTLRSRFKKAKLAQHSETIEKDASTDRLLHIPNNDLFQGAPTMLEVTNTAPAPSPPRPIGLTVRYIIRSRKNCPSSTNKSSDAAGLKPTRPSRRLSEISASSLAQPSVYFAPFSQLRCQRLDEQHLAALATPPALFDNDQSDHLDIQHKLPSTETQSERAATLGEAICRTSQGSLSEEANTQILDSSLTGPDPSSQFRSPLVSSRHLASGASSKDTFGLRGKPKNPKLGTTSVLFGGRESLSDPFIESKPEKECLESTLPISVDHSKTQVQSVTIADATSVTENKTPKSPARWSDDYDQFSSDGQNHRLTQVASGQYELLGRGYHLKPPPVLDVRIPRIRKLVPDDSSDEHEFTGPQPEHFIRQQQWFPQEQVLPQAIPVTMLLATAIENAQSAMNNSTQQLNNLVCQAQTHFWNAGVFAGRVASRDQELATALWDAQQKDAEIVRLRILLSTREAEIETLRARNLRGEHPAQYDHDSDDESETSDLYGGSDYHADIEDADGEATNDIVETVSLQECQGADNAQQPDSEDEDEVLLSPATDTRRYRLGLLETASDSAVLDLRDAPRFPGHVHQQSS